MIETSKLMSPAQGRIPSFKKFPLISSIEQLHNHNIHVAKICRQNTMQSLHNYHNNKAKYHGEVITSQENHVKLALDIEAQKRKSLEEKNRSDRKRNSDNLSKLERVLGQRREEMVRKELKMMERSQIRRQDYMKSLNDSFHHSKDKLFKIRQREENQTITSQTLFEEYQEKVESANQRKEEYVQELRQILRYKNSQINLTYQFSLQKQKKKEDGYIKRLINKFQKAEISQSIKVNKISEWLEERRKDQEKLKEKHLKKRTMLHEKRDRLVEEDHEKSQAKRQKAIEHKRVMLSTITNTLELKRKSKEKNIFSMTMSSLRQQEERIEDLNEKHRMTSSLWQTYKEEKQKMHSQHLVDSYIAAHRCNN